MIGVDTMGNAISGLVDLDYRRKKPEQAMRNKVPDFGILPWVP